MEQFIEKLMNERLTVKTEFKDLFDSETPIVPIPFFGDITKAKIITIGANPSAAELKINSWSEDMSPNQIMNKLLGYFSENPHKWFDTWENALQKIGYSYKDGSVAHVDLCAWATMSLSKLDSLKKTDIVLALFKRQINFFFQLLTDYTNPDLIIMAGTVTKKFYLNNFIYKHQTINNCCTLKGKPKIIYGGAFSNFHDFIIKEKSLRTLFLSVSPSARGQNKMGLLIEKNSSFFSA